MVGSLSVFAWVDLDRDGKRDGNEPPLVGAQIEVFLPEPTYFAWLRRSVLAEPIASCTTDGTGFCSFELGVGGYTVVETNPRGFTSTTSDSLAIEVREGEVTEVFFGDAADYSLYLPIIISNGEPQA